MYKNKKILAVIPARGGSKGIPRKNLRIVGGKPLIAWTIEAAKEANYIDRLVLSSEDAEIIEVARCWGLEAPFVRPKELAGDDIPAYLAVLDAVERLPGYDYVVMLQPAVPLRAPEDIDGCIGFCIDSKADSCVTLTETDKPPYWMYRLGDNNRLHPILKQSLNTSIQRQDLPPTYVLNGAVCIAKTEWFIEQRKFKSQSTIGYLMPRERSADIDTELDMAICEFLAQRSGS